MNKLLKQMQTSKGFTLIELLIVIAVIGLLAVALLSAINPAEQLKKARDASRKSDAAELLNAYERFYTTFNCYPWSYNITSRSCNATPTVLTTPSLATFTGAGSNSQALITTHELKDQFTTRSSLTGTYALYVSENANNQVSVCFRPESDSAQSGGLGPLRSQNNATACTSGTCYVCVPQ